MKSLRIEHQLTFSINTQTQVMTGISNCSNYLHLLCKIKTICCNDGRYPLESKEIIAPNIAI
jgi:hypothetical protein